MKDQNYDAEKLTFEDLRCHFETGRSYTVTSVSGRKRQYYRTGVQTNIGDIEISEWTRLVTGLIERCEEQELLRQLKRWVKDNCPWCAHDKDEHYALKLHAARIFENPKWAGYDEFRKNYINNLDTTKKEAIIENEILCKGGSA